MAMNTRWLLGLSAGFSAQGIDAALLEAQGVGFDLRPRLVQTVQQPFGRDLRAMLRQLALPDRADARQLAVLHRVLGEAFAAAARQVAEKASVPLLRVQCLGCSGFPFHLEGEGRFPSTVELGMAAAVAERTGITTVSDFAAREVVLGGLAAPLPVLSDYLLFHSPEEPRVVLDLGTVARVVYLPAEVRSGTLLAFEAGPCGQLLDGLMRQVTGGKEDHDAGGKHAVQGRCLPPLLERWLNHPFLLRQPPRSLPRLTFGPDFVVQAVDLAQREHWPLQDLLCTATHFVAHCLSGALQRFLPASQPPARVLLSGRGVRNGLLLHLLETQLAGVPLQKTDAFGIPAESRAAVASGIHAALLLDGVPANFPAATGAAGSRLLGSLTPGAPANWARCLAWMTAQAAPTTAEAA